MGVKNLTRAIRKYAPGAIRHMSSLLPYAGQTFAVDTSIFMYKFCATGQNPVKAFHDQARILMSHNITPIYVFDGRTAASKKPEAKKRKAEKNKVFQRLQQCEQKVAELTSSAPTLTPAQALHTLSRAQSELDEQRRRAVSYPTGQNFRDVKQKLIDLGVSVVQARNDAEKACAYMTKCGAADVVVTEDMDALPYGAVRMLTGFGKPMMVEYTLDKVLEGFEFDMAMFVDYCLLCGTDLCPKIRNIGNDRARRFIRAHSNIEGVLHDLDRSKYGVPESYPYPMAREEYCNGSANCIL